MTCYYMKGYRVSALPALADQELNALYFVSVSPDIMEIHVKGNNPLAAPKTISAIASAVGSNTQIQYNDNGSFGASVDFTWDNSAKLLNVNGNFRIPVTSGSGAGVIEQGGIRLLHSYGLFNLFLGTNSGNFTITGNSNIGVGDSAGKVLTSGNANAFVGRNAGSKATTGSSNVGVGSSALLNLTTGSGNIAIGGTSLRVLDAQSNNVSIGVNTLFSCKSSNNVAIGPASGFELTTGDQNVFIGAARGITTGSRNTVVGSISSLASDLADTLILVSGAQKRAQADSNKFEVFSPLKLPSYTVLTTPSASTAGAGSMIYVTNESGGAVPAFSDGTNWRRVTDRAIIS